MGQCQNSAGARNRLGANRYVKDRGNMRRSTGSVRCAVRQLTLACLAVGTSSAMAIEPPAWLSNCAQEKGSHSYTECIEPYSEGLAAVRTVSTTHEYGLWGFLDLQGRMAITPRFSLVESFSQGLAAAQQGERWGYINSRGEWVIPPQFEQASSFNPKGFAVINDKHGTHLIDRKGQPVKARLPVLMYGTPGVHQAVEAVGHAEPMQLWNRRTGQRVALPSDIRRLALPSDGLIPAGRQRVLGPDQWGALKPDLSWAATPEQLQSDQAPLHHAGVFVVHRESGYQFVNAQGEPLSTTPYSDAKLLAPGVWSVYTEKHKTQLLNAKLEAIFTVSELDDEAPYLHWEKAGPWQVAALAKGLLLLNKQGQLLRLPHAGAKAHYRHGKLWVTQAFPSDKENSPYFRRTGLIQALDDNGQAQLAPQTIELLKRYDAGMFVNHDDGNEDQPGWLVAELRPVDKAPPALLTAEGKILTSPTWDDAATHAQPSARVVPVTDQQGQTYLIGPNGPVAGPLPLKVLNTFQNGVTWADMNDGDRTVVLTESGQVIDLPDRLRRQCDRHFIAGQLTCGGSDPDARMPRYHLWNPLTGERSSLEHDDLEPIVGIRTHLKARKKDQWGVVNTRGEWVIPPIASSSSAIDRINDRFVSIEINTHGKTQRQLHELSTGLAMLEQLDQIEVLPDGSIKATTAVGTDVLLDPNGRTVLKQTTSGTLTAQNADWLVTTPLKREGLMDGDGNWVVQPIYSGIDSKGGSTPMFMVTAPGEDGSQVIDAQGRVVHKLAKNEYLTVGQHLLIKTNHRTDTTTLLNQTWQEIATTSPDIELLSARGSRIDPDSPDIVGSTTTGLFGFVDETGKPIVSPVFDFLDHLHNGLGLAMHGSKYGAKLGYVDRTGRFVIPARFNTATAFQEQRALVTQKDQMFFIDTQGQPVVRFSAHCGQIVIHDREGVQSWPQEAVRCSELKPNKKGKVK